MESSVLELPFNNQISGTQFSLGKFLVRVYAAKMKEEYEATQNLNNRYKRRQRRRKVAKEKNTFHVLC
jgi:hypothetical protein